MRTWKVLFEGAEPGAADDFELEFVDIRDILGKVIGLKHEAIDAIISRIKAHDNYHAIGNIKNVTDPEGEDLSKEAFFALLGIDKNELRFGFLILSTDEGTLIVGLWPGAYAEAVKDDERLLGGVIFAMIERPDNWRRVDLILPIKE